jgi:hypothetical protein
MKARSLVLAIVLGCGFAALAQAGTPTVASDHAKAMAKAQKAAKKRSKARFKAIQKQSNIKRQAVVHPKPKH